jgi:heme/copper-type cytochrome/quinol oxidase subunit 2
VVLPVSTHIRVLVTAADVLHSWAVPSLGVKVDACTGRLNQTSVFILREGVFYCHCWDLGCRSWQYAYRCWRCFGR